MKPLEEKQKAFCREYLVDLNATQAAMRAGYSKKTARVQAARMLSKVSIQAEIKLLVEAAAKRTDITVDRVLTELARVAFGDPRKFFDGQALKDMKDLSDDDAAALSSIEVFEEFEGFGEERVKIGYTKKIKFWDKVSALEKIARYLKMLRTDIDLTTGGEKINPVPPQIAEASVEELARLLKAQS